MPHRRRALALSALLLLALTAMDVIAHRLLSDDRPTLRALDLGEPADPRDRFRARLVAQLLRQMTEDDRIVLDATQQLRLLVPARLGLHDIRAAGETLDRRIDRLLSRPWPHGPVGGPPTLAAFLSKLDPDQLPRRCITLAESLAKPLARTICRDRAGEVSIAATRLPDGSIREWEIVVQDRNTGGAARSGIRFLVFDAEGRRTLTADFGPPGHARMLPAPQTCAACHYDAALDRFRRSPAFAGQVERHFATDIPADMAADIDRHVAGVTRTTAGSHP